MRAACGPDTRDPAAGVRRGGEEADMRPGWRPSTHLAVPDCRDPRPYVSCAEVLRVLQTAGPIPAELQNLLYEPSFLERLETGVRSLLPKWGLDPSAGLKLLNISENATYSITNGRTGEGLILRVYRPCYHTSCEIRSELAWIQAVRADG